jgi:diaminopimelate decarboxylase
MNKEHTLTSPLAKRLALFPDSTRVVEDTLMTAGLSLNLLAEEFGTPLYIYDRETMDNSANAYRQALAAYGGPAWGITYAGKAYLCKAIAEWVEAQQMWLDCTGEAEIGTAASGGVRRDRILVHGVNKSAADLAAAFKYGGTVVVDNLAEVSRLAALWEAGLQTGDMLPEVWMRMLPGIAVQTHHSHTQTGQHDSKFGMTPGELAQAVRLCRANKIPVKGLHFHQGSNFRDPSPLVEAIQLGLQVAREIGFDEGWHFSPGGGWGVAYHEDELPQPDIAKYVQLICENVSSRCAKEGLPLPHLHIEPGRSLVARAGVALYRVGAVKRRGERTWLLVDGGMTDNPRHAMYGARYSALPVKKPGRDMQQRVDIAGPFCESGDILIEDLPMPEMEEGELLAVPVSGAYQLSMSSNYNGARRPAVLWLEGGPRKLMQRRESPQDLAGRDLSIQV